MLMRSACGPSRWTSVELAAEVAAEFGAAAEHHGTDLRGAAQRRNRLFKPIGAGQRRSCVS